MAFTFNINANAAMAAGKGGSLGSGVHKVTILGAWLGTTKNGNNTIDLEVESDTGMKATMYGMCIDEKFTTGSDNSSFGVWNELAMITGMQTGATQIMNKTQFDGTVTQEPAFVELVNKVMTIGMQIVWDVNQDETKEVKRRNLYRVFDANGLSLAEKQAGETSPKASVALAGTLTDYKNAEWEALQTRLNAGSAAPAMAAPVAATVAPIAPVQAAPVQPTAPIAAPAAQPQVAAPQPQVVTGVNPNAVAQGMPVAGNPMAGQF